VRETDASLLLRLSYVHLPDKARIHLRLEAHKSVIMQRSAISNCRLIERC